MTNEQMERKMEFIVETLARVAVHDEKHEMRLSRLERIAKLMVRAGLRERQARREADKHVEKAMTEGDERLKKAMTELAEAQRRTEEAQQRTEGSIAHTDKRLDALIDIVRRQQNGHSS